MASVETERARLERQLRELGVAPGVALLVHTSFRRVGPLEGGPRALIAALKGVLGLPGTLVMPSFGDWSDDRVFDPRATPCRGMGVVADTFWRMASVLRSDSPHSFAAHGPLAVDITRPHPPEIPHGPDSPAGRVADHDGWVLLLGVGHDANTTIHLGEVRARVPYSVPHFVTVMRNGEPVRLDYVEPHHCCRNFALVGEWLAEHGRERRGPVGNAQARLMRSRDVVEVVTEHLADDPNRFLCRSGCDECDVAWAGAERGQTGSTNQGAQSG